MKSVATAEAWKSQSRRHSLVTSPVSSYCSLPFAAWFWHNYTNCTQHFSLHDDLHVPSSYMI